MLAPCSLINPLTADALPPYGLTSSIAWCHRLQERWLALSKQKQQQYVYATRLEMAEAAGQRAERRKGTRAAILGNSGGSKQDNPFAGEIPSDDAPASSSEAGSGVARLSKSDPKGASKGPGKRQSSKGVAATIHTRMPPSPLAAATH